MKEEKIKAEIWEIKICGSALDMVHNNYITIAELYIPSEKISVNLAEECLHCFASDPERYGKLCKGKLMKSTVVSSEFVERLKKYIKLQGKILTAADEILHR